ncbi:MAG TPA: XdhC/CoxI family protein [Opitutaceae bacterium]|nr:XdhC/CoxI family protein [Opitutaceae bacterium]
MKELSAILGRLEAGGPAPRVLATLVSVEGSSYRRAGARALFEADGSRLGSISGGCLEEDIRERARSVAASGRPEVALYDTTSENDLVWGTGAGCHGVVRVLLERLPARPGWAARLAENLLAGRPTDLAVVWQSEETGALGTFLAGELPAAGAAGIFRQTVPPAPALAIFGAGDDAQPLARGAAELGWRVTVADPRPAFATADRFPAAARIVAPADELAARVAPAPGALAVVMTHHYVHDLPVLRGLLPRPLAYLGLLGPRQRAERILSDLAAAGLAVTPAMRARLHAPVGLDLGSDGPEEVALSILAEMRAALSGRDGRPLRERLRPIHG